jgi:CBS-domain-containing membrane protein
MLEHIVRIKQEKLEAIGSGVETEAYRYWTGYIRCLKDMSDIVVAVRKKMDQD